MPVMSKGASTHRRILEEAISLSSTVGLEGLSIGALAKASDMSKSGLYAHFTSKQELQLEVLTSAREHFITSVFHPALQEPRGEPRLRTLFKLWLVWEERRSGGCPFVAASHELDDRPGRVREALVSAQQDWINTLAKAAAIAVEEGHFRKDLDTEQLAYDIYGVFLAFHLYLRLLRDPRAAQLALDSFEQLLTNAR